MRYLFGVTIVWAFSFSLIGVYLSGHVDAWFSVLMRIAIATMIFLPFLKLKEIKTETIFSLIEVGSVQLGLMYCFYFCLLYTSPSPRDQRGSRMPSSA